MPEIKKILKGCLSGNARDQELLYRRYSAKLYGVALQYTGSYDEARDVLQEGFIKIFTNLHKYSGVGSFEGWTRRIVVNTALEKHRQKYYLNMVEDIGNIPELNDNRIPDISGLEAEDLLKFIMELPPKYRMVFNLYALEGYSHKEIGKMLSISEGTSKSNLSRARGILQKKVEIHLGIKKDWLMVKINGNIDLVFRDGLKDMELLPPADMWSSIAPAISPSGTRGIFFRVAAGIAALVSLGLLSYFIGVGTSDSILGSLSADAGEAGNIEIDNSFMDGSEPIILAEAPSERSMSDVIVDNAARVQEELISPLPDNLIGTQSGNFDIVRSSENEASSGLHLPQVRNMGFNSFNSSTILASAAEDLSPKSRKWKLGAKMSPTYLSTNLKAANNSFEANTDNESAAISYTGGISVSYSMGGRLSLQTGVYYSSLARQISGIDSYSGFAGLTQAKGGKIFGVETSAGEIASTNNDIYLSDANSNRISSIGSVESFDPQKANLEPYGSALRQNFEYLEVPLILSYKLIDKKVDFNISGGLAYNFLLGNATYAVSEGSKIEIGSTEDLQPLLLSSAFAMSMEYALNDKFSFNIEPSLRYYLNSDGSLMSNNPFTFGFFSGLYFKF